MSAATYYEVLGIGMDADEGDVRAAYAGWLEHFRQAVGTAGELPVERLDAVHAAFHVLGDRERRRTYDAGLQTEYGRGEAGVPPSARLPEQVETGERRQDQMDSQAYNPALDQTTGRDNRELPFSFAGNGGEYFRIWIVNLLLSLLTLGIYSAWAKVRREQYFHRNLMLDGSGFDYHGQPKAILKGRAVAFLLLIGLSVAQEVGPIAYGLALLAFLPVLPWLAIKAMRFRALNTSFRGLRFSFHASYGEACKVFIGYGLLVPITLGLAFPLFYRQLRKFVLDHTRYGTAPLRTEVGIGVIYGIFALPLLLFVLFFGALALVFANDPMKMINPMVVVAIPLFIIVSWQLLIPYIAARTLNAVWGTATLGEHRFVSRLPVGGYVGLAVVNLLASILTLGLFIPWAKVRLARYRAEHMGLALHGSDLDGFVAGERQAAGAIGDEASEMFNLDIGL